VERLSAFFKDNSTRLGVFYPTHHLLAVFQDLSLADTAKRELQKAGVLDEDIISASGEEAMSFATALAVEDGIWGLFMTRVSSAIGTEAAYSEEDFEAARKGAAFVAVHCPTEASKDNAWRSLELQHPIAARYYAFGNIEHLAGEN
jgi:hypothetical protein